MNIQVVLSFLLLGYMGFARGAETSESIYLDPIEVKAKKSRPKSTEVTESNPETIENNPELSRSLTEVLQSSSSIFAQDSGTIGAPHIVLRAQDGLENRYFLDGVPLTDAQFNAEQISNLTMQAVGHIDVYPDGVPAGLVSDGLGGAVDFHLDDQSRSRLALKTGSFGYWEVLGRTALGGRAERSLSLNLTRSTEDYTYYDDGGIPFNPDSGTFQAREHNRYFRIGLIPSLSIYQSKSFDLKYFGINSFRALEIPGSVSLPLHGSLNQLFHLSAISAEKWWGEKLKAKTLLFAKLDSQKYLSAPQNKSLSTPESNQSADKVLGIRNQLQLYDLLPLRIEQTIAGTYERYDLQSIVNKEKITAQSRMEIPFSVSMAVPYKTLTVNPAFMVHTAIYEGKSDQKYVFLSPRMGAEVFDFANLKNLNLELSLGRYFRSPSMQELNGNAYGLSPATNLLAERADKLAIGFKYLTDISNSWLSSVMLSYNYSVSYSKDLITYVQNSQNSQVATNVGRSLVQSHEGTCDINLFRLADLNTKAIFLDAENLSDLPYHYGKRIPNRPKVRLLERLGYHSSNFSLAYQLQWIGERFWDLSNNKKMSATAEHGFFVNYNPKDLGEFSLEAINLLDTMTSQSTLSGFQTIDNTTGYLGYPAPGRRVYFSWSYQL